MRAIVLHLYCEHCGHVTTWHLISTWGGWEVYKCVVCQSPKSFKVK